MLAWKKYNFSLLFKGISYQQNTFKPSDAKIRRIQTPTQFTSNHVITQGNQSKMRPDSHGECFSFSVMFIDSTIPHICIIQ